MHFPACRVESFVQYTSCLGNIDHHPHRVAIDSDVYSTHKLNSIKVLYCIERLKRNYYNILESTTANWYILPIFTHLLGNLIT